MLGITKQKAKGAAVVMGLAVAGVSLAEAFGLMGRVRAAADWIRSKIPV